ncbi:aquaglyceroporin-like protein [Coleophoma cylindrospora]|uniref:Aquaglyceroporin-like protein n=1 Tax=Coleophoma cylindrospora TaxID=1849047 RepID=A0A3D8RSW7_9HELO|nr:aquaglyceroporin-like protein [Coleophoma cylindrospora]
MAEQPPVRQPTIRRQSQQSKTSSNTRPSHRPSTSRRQQFLEQDSHPVRPEFSLAGGLGLHHQQGSYVDPKYYELNPTYQRKPQGPLWGLAKPLPRVVRAGMLGKQDAVEDKQAEHAEPGSSEVIPQVGMIDEQREQVGKETNEHGGRNGYGGARAEPKRRGSQRSTVERIGTPADEKGDPMEDWLTGQPSAKSQMTDPFSEFYRNGDIGMVQPHRLSDVEEYPGSVTATEDFAHRDDQSIDLEAGDKIDDWPVDDQENERLVQEHRDEYNKWCAIRSKFREPLAECLATMIAVLIGVATDLAVQTSGDAAGSYQSTNWAWGLGVMIGIYIAGGISGGHLNPAISLMLCLYRGFPTRKAMVYIAAQCIGAFLAGLIAYGVYYDAIIAFDAAGGTSGVNSGVTLFAGGSGKSFFTQPQSFANAGTGFANEFVATAILACAILALGDDSNAPPGAGMHALIVGLVVTVLTMAFGYNTGACLNPARDFGPRAAAAAVGYGGQVFTARHAWWVYGAWGGTISGALLGGLLYDLAIFVGGESPVNYPRRKRKRVEKEAKDEVKRKWWGFRLALGKGLKGDLGKEG